VNFGTFLSAFASGFSVACEMGIRLFPVVSRRNSGFQPDSQTVRQPLNSASGSGSIRPPLTTQSRGNPPPAINNAFLGTKTDDKDVIAKA
jgi:hypothetical protein